MSASREHYRAMAIIEAGKRLRRLKQSAADPEVIRRNEREVWSNATRFLSDLLGEGVHPEKLEYEHPLSYARLYLHLLYPLFPKEDAVGVFWRELLGELGRMPYGDEPSILKPEPRLPGQSSTPARLAFSKLRAHEWATFFKAQGARPADYQKAIAAVFGADWDAIRHWRNSVARTVGRETVNQRLEYATDGYFIEDRKWHRSVFDPLVGDGNFHRMIVGLSDFDPAFSTGEWEKLQLRISMQIQAEDI